MTSPATILRTLLSMAKESLVVLCTDGGANDGKGVEVTGTSGGAINVVLGAGTTKIGKVTDQPLTVSDMGQTAITSAASTQVVTGHSGPGIVSITNPEDPGGAKAYLFPGTATSSKYILAPGCTWGPYSLTAVESIQARGSGSLSLSWDYLTVT